MEAQVCAFVDRVLVVFGFGLCGYGYEEEG